MTAPPSLWICVCVISVVLVALYLSWRMAESLYRVNEDKFYLVAGTKGHLWMEAYYRG
jgi:hypothetical protein